MNTRKYQLVVIGTAVSSFFVGMHVPMLHDMTHVNHSPRWAILGFTTMLAVAAIAGMWTLLRTPRR